MAIINPKNKIKEIIVLFFKKRAGFTLIEILVAMSMFLVISIGAIGVFSSTLKIQKKILANQELLNQTSYAMEYMSRAIRMARKDDISINGNIKNCLSGDRAVNYEITSTGQGGIMFRNYKDECQEFYLEEEQLKEKKDDNPSFLLTSPNITVNKFKIVGSGFGQNDNFQPSVTIFLDMTGKDQTKLQIQTTISQRNPDVEYQ